MNRQRWLFLSLAVVFLAMVSLSQAETTRRAALMVIHGDGTLVKNCVTFDEGNDTGLDILENSGLDLSVEIQGMGSTVCRLDNEGCDFPGEICFCQCSDINSNCVYWSYWLLQDNGTWQHSGQGASATTIKDGDVIAWVWGTGDASTAEEPPLITFDEVCAPAPATPTTTATPTQTSTPTRTPTTQYTPTAIPPTPVINSFVADNTNVNAGEDVHLLWNLSGATAAYLEYDGRREGIISPGDIYVSPMQTTIYTLIAYNGQSRNTRSLTVVVRNSTAPTATPTFTPLPTLTLTPTPATDVDGQETPVDDNSVIETPTMTPQSVIIIDQTPTAVVVEVNDGQNSNKPAPPPGGSPTPQLVVGTPVALLPTAQTRAIAPSPPPVVPVPVPAPPAETDSSVNAFLLLGTVSGLIALFALGGLVIFVVWVVIWWFFLRKTT